MIVEWVSVFNAAIMMVNSKEMVNDVEDHLSESENMSIIAWAPGYMENMINLSMEVGNLWPTPHAG